MGNAGTGAQAPDWAAIERSPEFRRLTTSRRRFAWTAGTIGIGLGALYVVLAGVAPDLMGTQLIGAMSLGFAGGVGLIVLTWAITLLYVLRSERVWGPLEAQIRAEHTSAPAPARFTRDDDRVPAGAEEPR